MLARILIFASFFVLVKADFDFVVDTKSSGEGYIVDETEGYGQKLGIALLRAFGFYVVPGSSEEMIFSCVRNVTKTEKDLILDKSFCPLQHLYVLQKEVGRAFSKEEVKEMRDCMRRAELCYDMDDDEPCSLPEDEYGGHFRGRNKHKEHHRRHHHHGEHDRYQHRLKRIFVPPKPRAVEAVKTCSKEAFGHELVLSEDNFAAEIYEFVEVTLKGEPDDQTMKPFRACMKEHHHHRHPKDHSHDADEDSSVMKSPEEQKVCHKGLKSNKRVKKVLAISGCVLTAIFLFFLGTRFERRRANRRTVMGSVVADAAPLHLPLTTVQAVPSQQNTPMPV